MKEDSEQKPEPTSESPSSSAPLAQERRLSRTEQVATPKKESNPLLLPILGGIGTLLLAIFNNFSNWYSNSNIEENKFNRELIQKVFTDNQDPAVRRSNFLFLLDTGVLRDKDGRFRKTLEALPLDKTPSFASDISPTLDKKRQLLSKRVGTGVIYNDDFTVNVTSDGPGGSSAEDSVWQPETSLKYADGRSVDSRKIPYVGLPKRNISESEVQLGDYVVVFDITTDRHAFAIVAGIAPNRNHMDLSVALANQLGLQFNLRAGTAAKDKVLCLAFPASGNQHCPESIAVLNSKGAQLFDAWGGMPNMQPYLKPRIPTPDSPESSPQDED